MIEATSVELVAMGSQALDGRSKGDKGGGFVNRLRGGRARAAATIDGR